MDKRCDYGCGEKAKYFFNYSKKWCCSKSHNSCPENIKKNRKYNKNRKVSLETRKKMSKSRTGFKDSKETKRKKSLARIGKKNPMFGKPHPNRVTCKDIKERYPFFSKVEEIRQNDFVIQVRCKLKSCRQWFIPTYDQLRYRIYALEHDDGNDGLFFYCSEECKKLCPSYNIKPPRDLKVAKLPYTRHQYEIFRKYVLERDNNKCQYCGEKAEHVHHERPQKLEPFFSLDPDFAWSCCEECHYKYGHKKGTECSNRIIALKECVNG